MIVAGEHLEGPINDALAGLGVELVIEPMARNTAPCIALAAARVAHHDPQGILAVLAADHFISDTAGFLACFDTAISQAQQGQIATLGIQPDRPETGYGYVQKGAQLAEGVYQVEAFVEKPDLETAQGYIQSGDYDWNSGMFFMRADVILSAIDRHMPGLSRGIRKYQPTIGTAQEKEALIAAFEGAEAISIDYGVMEHESSNIVDISADVGWSDVGSWRTLLDFRNPGQSNFIRGPNTLHEVSDSVIVSSGPMVSVIGLKGIAVVATNDAVMVVPLERAQEVGAMVKTLKKSGHEELT
jgi:mannose-1-phosphate guanylyltransferase